MNERIKELAKQAGMWRQHYDIGEESPSNLEEFAKLIIKECRTLMIDNVENQLTPDGLYIAFKEHFDIDD